MTLPSCSPPARRAALLALCCTSAGCVSIRTVPLGTETFAPRPTDHRIVFYDDLVDVPRPYVKVARIRGHDVLFGDVPARLQAEARRVGADALVLREPQPWCADGPDDDDWSAIALRFLP